MENMRAVNRWRLILGKSAEEELGDGGEGEGAEIASFGEMDTLLDFIYSREYNAERGIMKASLDDSNLTVPEWIYRIRELFPQNTVEKLETHALERYHLAELLTDKQVLEKLEPNLTLLKQILSLKEMMQEDVLTVARHIVEKVVEDLTRRMQTQVRSAIMGRRDRNHSTSYKCAKNFDFKKTIRKNLKNYSVEEKHLVVEKVYFNRNMQRFNPWHVIICVDESGSMMENVIHAAVMAGIFAKLPVLSTKLVIFDTAVVDLSGHVEDPVEALMRVQLGGGTDIGKALRYCESLLTNPHRTIVVLVSDLCDGGGCQPMYNSAASIMEAGAKLVCLTALDAECAGMYDRTAAAQLAALGASVAALTPAKLADWIGSVVGGSA